jgi:CHASE3 domain sensor protein
MDSTKVRLEDLPEIVDKMDRKLNKILEAQKNKKDTTEYLTRNEVMQRLKIGSYNTVIKLERRKILNPIRIGRKLLYKKTEVDNIEHKKFNKDE